MKNQPAAVYNAHVLDLADALEGHAHNVMQRTEMGDHLMVAGAILLAARELRALKADVDKLGDELARATRPREWEDEVPAAAPADAPERCRHVWDLEREPMVCTKCGKAKGKQGRRPKVAAHGVTATDPPTAPLPITPDAPPVQPAPPDPRRGLNAVAADRFSGGTVR